MNDFASTACYEVQDESLSARCCGRIAVTKEGRTSRDEMGLEGCRCSSDMEIVRLVSCLNFCRISTLRARCHKILMAFSSPFPTQCQIQLHLSKISYPIDSEITLGPISSRPQSNLDLPKNILTSTHFNTRTIVQRKPVRHDG